MVRKLILCPRCARYVDQMIDYAWVVYHLRYCQYRSPSGASMKGGGEAGVTGNCLFILFVTEYTLGGPWSSDVIQDEDKIQGGGGGLCCFLLGCLSIKSKEMGPF